MEDHKPDSFSQYIGDDYAHNHSNEEDNCDHGCYAHQCPKYRAFIPVGRFIYGSEIMQTELTH